MSPTSSNYTGYYSSPTHYRGSRGKGGGAHDRTALLEQGIPPAGSIELAKFCEKLLRELYRQRIFPDLHNIKHRVAEIVMSGSGGGQQHHHLNSNKKNSWVGSPTLEKGMTRIIQYFAAPSQAAKYAVIADPHITHTYREATPFPVAVDEPAPDVVALEAIFARISKNGQNCCVLFRETPTVPIAFDGPFYFISPHADDIYTKSMWEAFKQYLDNALEEGRRDLYIFPKGRYSCAHALESRKLHFFKGLTMGHLINVVQLAMSKYSLLMFDEDKSIRPPQAAQKVIRSQQRKPSEESKLYQRDGGPFIGSLDELKFCLQVIFQIEASGSISMCRIKNMISQYCHRQLSETKFGESRLSDLMARPELQDTVELVRTCGSTPWLHPRGTEEPTPQLLIRPAQGLVISSEPLTEEVAAAWSRSRRLPSPDSYQRGGKERQGLTLPGLGGEAAAGSPTHTGYEYLRSPTNASTSTSSMASVMTPMAHGGVAAHDDLFGYSPAEGYESNSQTRSPWYHQMVEYHKDDRLTGPNGPSVEQQPPMAGAWQAEMERLEKIAETDSAISDVLSELAKLVAAELGPVEPDEGHVQPEATTVAVAVQSSAAPAAVPQENNIIVDLSNETVVENSDEHLLLSPTKLSLLRELLELHEDHGGEVDDSGGVVQHRYDSGAGFATNGGFNPMLE
ncbi:hypothetical protein FOL47_007179 [Perkinsus chesapeaki]|uniref:HTH OST-type domain-containing protein n=1 Tax=Perkinsus chesapeaki TaxID=330153 RepID=A0A7J6LMQ9_PERCH|nr:hypothetical protein FOL47_007179 [Perkinsus chesapeaki]